MSTRITRRIANRLRVRNQHRKSMRAFASVAVLVVICVALMLRQNGRALTHEVQVLDCPYSGVAAHHHTSDCYDEQGNLVCPLSECDLHVHDDSCYATETALVCGYEEGQELADGTVHTHTDACFETTSTLICGQEEILEEHVHGPACFRTVVVNDNEPGRDDATADADVTARSDASQPTVASADDDMPAQTFEHKFEDTNKHELLRVSVDAPQGALPAGTTMEVAWIDGRDVDQKLVEEALAKRASGKLLEFQAVDITFRDAQGQAVEPAKKITVTFKSELVDTDDKPMVVHVESPEEAAARSKAEGTKAKIEAEVVSQLSDKQLEKRDLVLGDDELAFDADQFSTYVLAVTSLRHTMRSEGQTVTIVVDAPAAAGIPADAQLQVTEYGQGTKEHGRYEARALEALGADDATLSRFFDITIVGAEGQAIQPAEPVHVKITLADAPAEGDAAVVHFGKEPELVDAREAAGTTSFDAQGFSVYGVVYTVDFTYEGYEYHLSGNGSMSLSELFTQLGITDSVASVRSVTFSDSSLLAVSGPDASGDWTLTSLKPFVTQEVLTVTLPGKELSITVTDAVHDNLAGYITDATLTIDGKTYGAGTTWNVRPDVDYVLTLKFSEKGSRQFPKGGEEMVMDPPAGMRFEPGMSGTFDIPCGLAGTIKDNSWWVDDDGKLHIKFGPDPKDILTRSNNVYFDFDIFAKFDENASELVFNDSVTRNVHIDQDTDVSVSKSGSYNAETGKMEYTVKVTSTGASKNVHVQDAISGNMLTLDTDSITIEPASKNPSSKSATSSGFDITFAEMAHNETVTIKYTASVDESKLGPNGKVTGDDGKNNVTVTNDQGKTDTSEHVQNTIKFSDVSKSSTGQSEVEGEDKVEMEWKIVANEGCRGSIVGGTITDKVDHDSRDIMEYVKDDDGNVTLKVVVKDANGNVVKTLNNVKVPVTKTGDGNQETWTYTIPGVNDSVDDKQENYSYEITYKTLVTKQANDMFAKNNVTNESGGSTSGSGIVPGTNPGGGGGETPSIVTQKTAKKVTEEYVDWDIVINVPEEGFDSLVVTDYLPWQYGSECPTGDFADTLAGEPKVDGLVGDESFTWQSELIDGAWGTADEYLKRNGEPMGRTKLTLTFFKDGMQSGSPATPGLNNTARTVTITLRTKNDETWLAWAAGEGGNHFNTHTNNGNVNGVKIRATASPVLSTLVKTQSKDWPKDSVDGLNGLSGPFFYYDIQLSNVTEEPVIIEDTFDTELLEFVDISTYQYAHKPAYYVGAGVNNYDNITTDNNTPTYTPTSTGLRITADNLLKQQDGSFYPFYHVRYYLRVKDGKLDELKRLALANGGTYTLSNTATWNNVHDDCDVDYKVPGLKKEGSFDSDNERAYNFLIDVNREALTMNGGQPMDLTDTHTDNLSVDYSSIKVYKITDGQSNEDPKQYDLTNAVLAPKSEVSWNFVGNEGIFTVQDNTHYLISYKALVIGSGNQTFSNEATMKGFYSTKSDNKTYGGSAHGGGAVYQINLLKYESGKTSNGLEGTTFQLFKGTGEYDANGVEIKEPMKYGDTEYTRGATYVSDDFTFNKNHDYLVGDNVTYTTGADGTVLITLSETVHGNGLELGTHYYLKEIDSPPGYKIDASVEYWEFTLTSDPDEVNYGDWERLDENGRRQWIYFSYGDILKMSNTPTVEPLTVSVNKEWYDKDGNQVTGEALTQFTKTAQVQLLRKKSVEGDETDYAYVPIKVTYDNAGNPTVTELAANSTEGQVTLDGTNNWAQTWEKLPRVLMGGPKGDQILERYAYKIEEVEVEGYSVAVEEHENATTKTYTFKNYEEPDERTTSLTVNKRWQDAQGNPVSGTKESLPASISFNIYQVASTTPFTHAPTSGGSKYVVANDSHYDAVNQVYTITKAEDWTATFDNLPEVSKVSIGDNEYETLYYAYYVKEIELQGYTTTYATEGTTRTIINAEPLPEGKYIDIDLEKKWTDGESDEPPAGASATFTVHQQKATKQGGSSGNLTVNLYASDGETLLSTRKANVGDLVSFSWTAAEGKNPYTNISIYRNGGWEYCSNAGGYNTVTFTYDSIVAGDVTDGTVKFKIDSGSLLSECDSAPAWDAGEPTWSDYTDTGVLRTVTLPYKGRWSTTIKDLIQEDEDGNRYRYYLTETSASPEVKTVTFKDSLGTLQSPISEMGQKVEATNTYENSTGALKIQKTGTVNGVAPTDANKAKIDGTYRFTIAGKPGTATASCNVVLDITLQGGIATAVTKDSGSTPATVEASVKDGVVTLDKLPAGDYTVTEELTSAQKQKAITLASSEHTELTVSADKTAEVPTATFVNNVQTTELNVSKLWDSTSPSDHPTSVTFKIYRVGYYQDGEEQKPASEDFYPDDDTVYRINGSEPTKVADLPATAMETVGGVERLVNYVYRVVEQPVEGSVTYWPSYTIDGTNVTITNTPVAEATHETELSVSKSWLGKDGVTDTSAAHANDKIEFTVKQVPHDTGYVPVTLVYLNADNSQWGSTQELFVKEGASLDFTFKKGDTLFNHTVEMTVGNRRTSIGGRGDQYTFSTGAITQATTITARQTFSYTRIIGGRTYYDRWGDTVQDLDYAYQWTSAVTASSGTLYTDYASFYDAMAVDSNKGTANEYQYTLGKSKPDLTTTNGLSEPAVAAHADADWTAAFTKLPQLQKVGDDYVVYTYEVSEIKIKPHGKEEESVGNTQVEGFQGESNNYLVKWQQKGTAWAITNQDKPGIDITIKKVDAEKAAAKLEDRFLSGAKFSLYLVDGSDNLLTDLSITKAVTEETVQLDDEGKFEVPAEGVVISGLANGSYKLVEREAPDGYILDSTTTTFTVVNGQVSTWSLAGDPDTTLEVPNTPGTPLPNAGGAGTYGTTAAGCALLLAAAAHLLRKRSSQA